MDNDNFLMYQLSYIKEGKSNIQMLSIYCNKSNAGVGDFPEWIQVACVYGCVCVNVSSDIDKENVMHDAFYVYRWGHANSEYFFWINFLHLCVCTYSYINNFLSVYR